MNYRNNYLRILIFLMLFMQTSSATMDYFLTYYIPIESELDINSMDKDGIRLYKAISYTYYSEPESAISSITQKYIINTPHKEKEADYMRNYNINLAYIKGLNVELIDYGSSECKVVMDSSKVISDYSVKELEKILKYVKKATKLNMKEHKINCAFKEIKAFSVVETLALPKALNLEKSAFPLLEEYSSGIEGVPFIYNNFYPLGYNSDGKFAYIKEYDTDPADMVLIRTFVQDLVTDKILWEDEFKFEGDISTIGFKDFWVSKSALISKKIKEYGIKPFKNIKFEPNSYRYNNNFYSLDAMSKSTFRKDWDMEFLDSSTIMLSAKGKGSKVIDTQHYKKSYLLARRAIGFIPLGGNDRIAVVVANVQRGWEGPPHNLSYDIVGASLKVGFK